MTGGGASAGGAVVLVGPPGAGCSSVGRALAEARGLPWADLGESVAAAVHARPDLALVAVAEERYRRIEADMATGMLEHATRVGGVVALGSGCLGDQGVRRGLEDVVAAGGIVVALTASTRRLASRNGLDAPRSVALGNVRHEFVRMLREREAVCRSLATSVLDTSDTTPAQVADAVPVLG